MRAKISRLMAIAALLLTGLGAVGSPPLLGEEPKALDDMID